MIQEIRLKNYQKKALHEININYANGIKSQLLIMATGTGKTVVFCEFIKELISVNKKVLVLVHRDELINQAERRLKLHTNEPFGIEKAERKANNENIVLASVQTLKGKRLKKFAKDYFDAIIIDECHRSTANSYMTVRKHFNKSHVLGVTATPERQDDLKITKRHFQKIAFTYNILDAIKEGNLSNIKVWRVESEQDISGVKSNSDDLDQKELAKILDNKEYIEFIYKTIQEKASNKKIMVFMPSVKLSDKLCDFLNSKGIQSFSVSSNTPLEKRQEVLDDYRTGKIQVLSNYNIFTEGFDEPSIDCVIMARPTKSLIFYSQALGRMTRLFHGKEYGMFIDIGFINGNHKISNIFNLIDIDNKYIPYLKDAISNLKGTDLINAYSELIRYIKSLPKPHSASNNHFHEDIKLKFINSDFTSIINSIDKKEISSRENVNFLYNKFLENNRLNTLPKFIEVDFLTEKDQKDLKYKNEYRCTLFNTQEFVSFIKKLYRKKIILDFHDVSQKGYMMNGYDLTYIHTREINLYPQLFRIHDIYMPVNKKTFLFYLEYKYIVKDEYKIDRPMREIQSFIDSARNSVLNSASASYAKRRKKELESMILLQNLYNKINAKKIKRIDEIKNLEKKCKVNLSKNVSKEIKKIKLKHEEVKKKEDESLREAMRNLWL